ncbi:ABC transporter permease [Janibacter cremeus]|uniref:ABC-type transport system involved in multi-copper enzyme maturation permease subunit n=1 Tax=Janibacter cremeus TaxID=1285192 RepID=A0A852VJT0_9MICO|nr:ABC transporter permease subunit [Janibacter cremeus]NYF97367.1 ABC-type transport system involved in multi-copper enzyme maturation permease subunit [Janibacter cremeus]
MLGAIRSEFRKYFTTRMWWGMAIAVFLVSALFAGLFGFLMTMDQSGVPPEQQMAGSPEQVANSVYTAGLSVAYLLTLAVGVMQIGSEYRHKTITSTFLGVPRRATVMGAKVISLLAIGAMYGVISLLGSVGVGALVLSARGAEVFPAAGVARTLALSLLVLGLWALIGLGAGILIPNQVAALLIAIGVAWIVEPLAGVALTFWDWGQDVAQFLPSAATQAMVSGVTGGPNGGGTQLEWWGGALVLIGYAALLAGIGSWRTVRADIS